MMENNLRIIEHFLDNELEGEQLEWFHHQLRSNRQFIELFQVLFDMNHAIREEDIIRLRRKLDLIYQTHQKDKPGGFLRGTRRTLYLAASFVGMLLALAGMFYVMNDSHSADELYGRFYKPYQPPVTFIAVAGSNEDLFRKAMYDYEHQRYHRALDHFNAILKDQPGNTYVLFYTALSYLETGNIPKAQEILNSTAKAGSGVFTELSRWYLGLSYLKTDEEDKAGKVFRELVYSNSHFKEKAALIVKYLG